MKKLNHHGLIIFAAIGLLLTGCSTTYRQGVTDFTHPHGAGEVALSVVGLPLWIASWPILDPMFLLTEDLTDEQRQEVIESFQQMNVQAGR
jgi:hypothetical protein